MSTLEIEIGRRHNRHTFRIVDFNDDIDAEFDSERFGNCIEWTIEQLATHPRCKRMSYDTWYFESSRELTKFQTFWALKWLD